MNKEFVYVVFGMMIDSTSINAGIFTNEEQAIKCRNSVQNRDGYYYEVRRYKINQVLEEMEYQERFTGEWK